MFRRVCATFSTGCSLFLLLQAPSAGAASDIGKEFVIFSAVAQNDAIRGRDALDWSDDDSGAAPLSQRQIRLAAANPLPALRRASDERSDPPALPPNLTPRRGLPSLIDTVLMVLFGSALVAYPLIRKQRALLRSAVTAM